MHRMKAKVRLLRRGDKVWFDNVARFMRVLDSRLGECCWEVWYEGRDIPHFHLSHETIVEVDRRTAKLLYGANNLK